MSHIVTLEVRVTDREALVRACQTVGAELLDAKAVTIFETAVPCECAVRLQGWHFPVAVCQDGRLMYDDYGGRWGDRAKLDKLLAEYQYEVVKAHYAADCREVQREDQADGTIKVLVFG